MAGARWVSAGVGAAAAALVLIPLAADPPARSVSTDVSLPDRLAGYSHLTGELSDAAPGRAVALYQHGFGVELGDFPQAVVLAADDDVYRRLDAAEDRGGPETQGDPGPMLLSPDGLAVALGDHSTLDPELGVVDVRTGAVTDHGLPDGGSIIPVAWAPDGHQVAYLARDEPTNPYSPGQREGVLHVLDLRSGEARPVPGAEHASGAAFSPDGRLLAVQQGSDLVITDLTTGTSRSRSGAGVLAGSAAWSPDGRLLALTGPSGLSFVDPDAAPESEPTAGLSLAEGDRQHLLGWTGPREVAVFTASSEVARIISRPLGRSGSRELTRIEDQGSFGVNRMQLASSLLPELDVRDAGRPERGPLPATIRITLALVAWLAVAAATRVVLRLLRRRRASRTMATAPAPEVRARGLHPAAAPTSSSSPAADLSPGRARPLAP